MFMDCVNTEPPQCAVGLDPAITGTNFSFPCSLPAWYSQQSHNIMYNVQILIFKQVNTEWVSTRKKVKIYLFTYTQLVF